MKLRDSGNLDDWDFREGFLESDLDKSGDFWVVWFEAAEITVKGTWNAPITTYSNTIGATVKMFRFARGNLRSAGKTRLNRRGNAVFRVRDRNGYRRTAYIAKVLSTSTTVSATSKRMWLR